MADAARPEPAPTPAPTPTTASSGGPGRLRRWLLRPLAWLLTLLLVAAVSLVAYLGSATAREQLRSFVVARLVEATGRPAELGAVALGFFPLRLEVENLRIPGPTAADPPVVELPYGSVEVSLRGLRRPVLRLERIELRRPHVVLQVAENGQTNLPALPPSSPGENRLQIEIGSLLVADGRFDFDELSAPVNVAAREVAASLQGHGRGEPLTARLHVAAVETTLPGARPYPLALTADLTLAEQALTLNAATLKGPELTADVHGVFAFEPQGDRLDLRFSASGETAILAALGWTAPGEVSGPFRYDGGFAWNAGEWLLDGELASERLQAAGFTISGLRAAVVGDRHELRFPIRAVGYAGGQATGQVRIPLGTPPLSVETALTASDVDLVRLLADLGVPLAGLDARIGGELSYRFATDRPLAGDGAAQLSIRGGAGAGGGLPLTGHGALRMAGGALSTTGIRLLGDAEQVDIHLLEIDLGRAAGRLGLRVASQDVGRLTPLLPLAPAPEPPTWLPTGGRGDLWAELAFGRGQPLVAEIGLGLAAVVSPGLVADRLDGTFLLGEGGIRDLDLSLARGGGELTVAGDVPFAADAGGIQLRIAVDRWPYADLAGFVPAELPLAGPVSGRLSLAGEADALTGVADVRLEPLSLGGVALASGEASFELSPAELRFSRLAVTSAAGRVEAQGKLGLGAETPLDFAVSAPQLALGGAPLADVLPTALAGTLSFTGHLGGTLGEPSLTARVTTAGLQLAGPAASESGGEAPLPPAVLGELAADLDWTAGRLALAARLGSSLSLEGGGPLSLEASDLRFTVASPDVAPLAALAVGEPVADLQGRFAGTLTVSGPPSAPRAALSLPQLEIAYDSFAARALEPVAVRYEAGTLHVDSLYLGDETPAGREPGGELFLGGKIALGSPAALDLRLQGTFPAAWLDPLVDGGTFGGTVSALGRITGNPQAIRFDGQADVAAGRAVLAGFPHALEDLRAVVLVYPDQLVLDTFQARFAGGRLQAGGSLALGPNPGSDYQLQASLADFHLRYPEGWVLEGGAELVVTPVPGGRLVRGRVDLARAFYLQDLQVNLFQILSGFLRRQRLEVTSAEPALVSTQLNVLVQGPGALRVKNNLADLEADVDLAVRGNLARPVVVGRVEASAGGTLSYADNEYEIDRGLLTFASLDRIDPVVDLVARAQIREYEVTLNLSGTLERLNASLSSDPPLPDLDVLALLSTGSRFDEAAAGGSPTTTGAPSSSAAEMFIAGQAASAISSRVKTLFGFDKFRIDPTTTAGGSVGAARFIVGKRVSRNLSVTYQFNASENQQNVVQAEWQVAPGLVVVFSAVDGDEYAVDLRWEKRF